MSGNVATDPLDIARGLLQVDDHAFQGVVTKLRTTKGSPFALDVMKEGADRIDALTAALRALVAKAPKVSGPPRENSLWIAERISRTHRTQYSTAGWRCECGYKYASFGFGNSVVEDHRITEAVLAGLAARADEC